MGTCPTLSFSLSFILCILTMLWFWFMSCMWVSWLFSFFYVFKYSFNIRAWILSRPTLKQSSIWVTKNKWRVWCGSEPKIMETYPNRTIFGYLVQLFNSFIVLAIKLFVSWLDSIHWTKLLVYICFSLVNLIGILYSLVLVVLFYFKCKHLENAIINYMALDVKTWTFFSWFFIMWHSICIKFILRRL